MASDNSTGTAESPDAEGPPKEPSLGPACLVISMLGLALFMAICAFGTFFYFSDQPELAERGITQQLVPWVEASNLAPADKQAILAELEDVVEQVRSRQLTTRQLTRLRNTLEDNPVLLWGTVQGVLAQADEAGMTQVEIDAGQRVQQRLLRAAAERKLGRNDLVYFLEGCTHARSDGQGLEVNSPLTAAQIQEFLNRAEHFLDGLKVSSEPYEKSVPEVFRDLIEQALSVK